MRAEIHSGGDLASTAWDDVSPGWYIACESRQLRARPVSAVLARRPLALFRDAQGRPHALEDRCAHRNAPLSAGTVRDGRLHCPYHGWSYTPDGRVASIPACRADVVAGEDLRVAALHATEQDGFVWVWLGAGEASGRPIPFPHFGEPGWTSFTLHNRFQGPVEACLENFLDCPHAAFVHRYWFRAPTGKPVRAVVRTREDGIEAEFFEEPRERSLVWWLLAPRAGSMRHTDRFIAPATSRVDYEFPGGLHYVITSSCAPVADAETQVTTVVSFRYRGLGPLVRLFFEPLARRIIRQDVDMLRMQAANIARFGGPRFSSTAVDLLGPGIMAWRKALARGEAPPFTRERHVELRL